MLSEKSDTTCKMTLFIGNSKKVKVSGIEQQFLGLPALALAKVSQGGALARNGKEEGREKRVFQPGPFCFRWHLCGLNS